jgi:hypothetical protein
MKKNIVFVGLGIILTTILTFLFRLINAPFFQDKLKVMILMGIIGVVVLVIGLIWKMKKVMIYTGLGALITAILMFLIRLIGLNDNVALMIIFEIIGLIVLIYGLAKGK